MSTMAVLATHSPRIIDKKNVKEPFTVLSEGMEKIREEVEAFKPDVMVVLSTHWFSTFSIYANATPIQAGLYTAAEAPENINRIPYKFNGDPELAEKIVENGIAEGLPCKIVNDESLLVDYGTLVPVDYFDPENTMPVVSLSVCMNNSTDDYFKLGNVLAKTFKESGKKVLFVASGSLAHYHSRTPEDWPPPEMKALDEEVIEALENLNFEHLRERLEPIAEEVRMEGYGFHVATLVGVLEGFKDENVKSNLIAYGPSSGTGNACMTFKPAQ